MKARYFALILMLLVHAACVFGDTVYLKNGGKVSGVVLSNTKDEVRIRTDAGSVTFSQSKVTRVEVSEDATLVKARLASWETCLSSFNRGHWGGDVEQIPATVIDKGVMMRVPYMSHRSGSYEMNIYGDPDAPACVEIGVYGNLVDDPKAKVNCRTFIKSILGNASDVEIIDKLKPDVDSVDRDGLTFEVTPPTADDAYGGWWISVYSTKALDSARASEKELASITAPRSVPKASPATSKATSATMPNDDSWSADELMKARKPATESTGLGGSVYVRGYTRKDGTYVHSYTRSAPSRR